MEVWPEEGQSLGLSIVGGRHIIKRLKNGEELKGIFIKQVLPNSPAAKTRCLKTGDKILEVGPSDPLWTESSDVFSLTQFVHVAVRSQVSGVDLRAANHEEAVSAIKSAPSPVVFVVQSLSATPRVRPPDSPRPQSGLSWTRVLTLGPSGFLQVLTPGLCLAAGLCNGVQLQQTESQEDRGSGKRHTWTLTSLGPAGTCRVQQGPAQSC